MKLKALISVAACLSLALCAGILALCWFEYRSALIMFIVAGVMAVSLVVCSAVHEAGHALFGLFSGIRAKVDLKSICGFLTPSSCKIIPRTHKNVAKKLCFTVIGGLVLNFLFIVFGVISLCVEEVPAYLSALTPASLYLFMINAAPVATPYGKTDGLVFTEVIKGEPSAVVMVAVLTAQARVLAGENIAELDEKLLFDLPQIAEDDMNFIALTQLRRDYYKAKGDEEKYAFYAERFSGLEQYLR